MSIKYTPPPTITVDDDGYLISNSVEELDFGTGLAVTDDGYGKVTIDAASGGNTIAVEDDGVNVSSSVDTIDFDRNLAVTDEGGGTVSVDSTLGIRNDGYFIDDAYQLRFTDFFSATTDSYGSVTIDAGAGADVLSPGFTWGRSGQVGNNAYLLNDTVPSNLAGRVVPIVSGTITQILVANQDANTFDVVVQKRLGPGSFLDVATVSLVAERTKVATPAGGIPVVFGDEIAVKINNGAAKQPVVGLIITGG